MNPASGVLIDLRANFADEALGSDFDYQTSELSGELLSPPGPGVLALRGYACPVSDRAPLFDLCLFGAGSDLRGYEAGRYRDRAMFALQAEYRFPLAGRFGGVVFGGTGKVARSFGDMGDDRPAERRRRRALARLREGARQPRASDVARAARDSTERCMSTSEEVLLGATQSTICD